MWAGTIFVPAAMYGSVFGELENFPNSNELLRAIFAQNPDYSLVEQFIATLMVIMSLIVVLPVAATLHRVAGEENQGYAEHLLGRAVSRKEQMAAVLVAAGFAGYGRRDMEKPRPSRVPAWLLPRCRARRRRQKQQKTVPF